MPDLSPIHAQEHPLQRLFSDDFAFEVPAYQRPYGWQVEEVRDLLHDLTEAVKGAESYFLGSLVLVKSAGAPLATIVDGQQRLITLTIMLAVLRDLTTDDDLRMARRGWIFQRGNRDLGTTDQFRLLLAEPDRAFFKLFVQMPDATGNVADPAGLIGSHRQIAENTAFLRAELETWSEARRDRLAAFMMQHCYFVAISAPAPEAARRIFSVLNTGGRDLAATDVLKGMLLDRAGDAKADLLQRWNVVEAALGRDSLIELFGHIRMIHLRQKCRAPLEESFPKAVPQFLGEPAAFISDVLEPLATCWQLLQSDSAVHPAFGAEAAQAVRSLGRVGNRDWMPPALLMLWRQRDRDPDAVGRFLMSLERLAYYLLLTHAENTERVARFAGVIEMIDPSADRHRPGLELSPAEQAAFIEALDGPLYREPAACRAVLERLDEALGERGAGFEPYLSIEPVLPQHVAASGDWARLFPDEQVRAGWVHRIGNLAIVVGPSNAEALTWEFAKKRRDHFAGRDGSSPFPLTQGVLQTKQWNAAHLAQRQAALVGKLCEIWRLRRPQKPLLAVQQSNVQRRPAAPLSTLDRIRGCLLGGAVGDALGAAVEFDSLDEIRSRFGEAGVQDYAPVYGRRGAITDDTQMTLFTAEGMMRAWVRAQKRGISGVSGVIQHAYLRWLVTQGEQPDQGVQVGTDGWLFGVAALHSRREPGKTSLSALRATESVYDPAIARNDSKGCGGIMRVAPIGLFATAIGGDGRVFSMAADAAKITHGHPSGYLAAGYLAVVIAALKRGEPLAQALDAADTQLRKREHNTEVARAVAKARALASFGRPTPELLETLGQGWVAEEALAIAVCSALVAKDFADGVLMATNHGGDSDSTAGITGSLLGAMWGEHAIPEPWLDELELRPEIERLAGDLCAIAAGQMSSKEAWEAYPGW
jgi:ADP-ribosylglycohydrolase